MSRRKAAIILIPILIVIGYFCRDNFALAYHSSTTHPALTENIIDLFNAYNGNRITPEEKEFIIQGSIEEDTSPRYVNHFYDPVHNTGWTGDGLGSTPSSTLRLFAQTVMIPGVAAVASPVWAQDEELQTRYSLTSGNQTWQQAVRLYVNGDKRGSFIALGHILHLIEDATVPDHTRDDTHAGEFSFITHDKGSPYEDYASRYIRSNLFITSNLIAKGQSPIYKKSLQEYFNSLANYSNNNFVSEDTIQSNKYELPKVKDYDYQFAYYNDGSDKYPLYEITFKRGQDLKMYETYTVNNSQVLSAYFSRLSTAAVQNGAGVVKLFFDEAEKAKADRAKLAAAPQVNIFNQVISVFGLGALVKERAEAIYGSTVSAWDQLTKPIQLSFGLAYPEAKVTVPPITPAPIPTGQVLGEKIIAGPTVPPPAQNQILKQVQDDKTVSQAPNIVPPGPTASLSPQPSPVGRGEAVQHMSYGGGGGGPALDLTPPSGSPDGVVNTTTDATTTEQIVTSTPDITPPSVPILAVKNVTNASTTEIKINVASSDSESKNIYFDFEIATSTFDLTHPYPAQAGNATATLNWVGVTSSTTSTDMSVNGVRGNYYYFRARAADESGNVSKWSCGRTSPAPAGASPSSEEGGNPTCANSGVFVNWTSEVIINEVAWAGTSSQFPSDEWFELYNTTDSAIDIKQWQIKVSGTLVNFTKISTTTILPHSLLLLERGRDGTVNDIAADVVYTLSGGFNNSGEKLELFKPNGDKADEVDCSGGWFGGDNTKYRTMERIDPLGNGDDQTNWQSNKGFRMQGRTYNGGSIYGSPRQPNKGFIALNGAQEDVIRKITADDNPYVLGTYDIPIGYTLQIDSGVVIKSYYSPAVFNVYGSLSAEGTKDVPITFTSGRDQSFNDANLNSIVGTWSTTTPAAKDWQGFWLRPGASLNLAHAHIRYGGKDFRVNNYIYTGNVSQVIRTESASVMLSDSHVEDSGGVALHLESSSTSISHSNFARGTKAVESIASKVSVDASDFGFFTDPSGPFDIKDAWPELNNLTLHDNAINVPHLTSVEVSNPGSMRSGAVYISGSLVVPASSSLSVDAGATFYMGAQSMIDVKGAVTMSGEQDNPIRIVPFASGTYWANLFFTGSTSSLTNVVMLGGNGAFPRFANNDGMMILQNSHVTCDGCVLMDSKNSGNSIQSTDSSIMLKNSVVGFSVRPPYETTGVKITDGSINLDNTNFTNLTTGIYSWSNPPPPATFINMSSSSFNNVDNFTQPIPWWGSAVNAL